MTERSERPHEGEGRTVSPVAGEDPATVTFWEKADKTTEARLILEDPDGWYDADVRFDGCINFRRYHNQPKGEAEEDDSDYIHICELDDFILRLFELRILAKKHFGGEWE